MESVLQQIQTGANCSRDLGADLVHHRDAEAPKSSGEAKRDLRDANSGFEAGVRGAKTRRVAHVGISESAEYRERTGVQYRRDSDSEGTV